MGRRCKSSASLIFVITAAWAVVVPLAAQEDRIARSYRIGPRDQLQIHVEEMERLNQEVTVAEDGTISLPVVGTLVAGGLTEAELASRLSNLLETKGLRTATVTISVTNFRSRPVSILGAVSRPGNHLVPGRSTLLEVLMDAGGLTSEHGREIVVRRRADNGLAAEVRIPVADLIVAGSANYNIPVFAGDLINVLPERQISVHVIGEVNLSGTLELEAGLQATLLTAIARSGGLTENASKRIRIRRRDASGEREIVVDFRRVLNNRDPDVPLEDGDLIIVKESFF